MPGTGVSLALSSLILLKSCERAIERESGVLSLIYHTTKVNRELETRERCLFSKALGLSFLQRDWNVKYFTLSIAAKITIKMDRS